MSLHVISVFDKVYKLSSEKKCTCYVRLNGKPDGLFSGDIQS